MNAFEALAKLDSSNVTGIRGSISGIHARIQTIHKAQLPLLGLYLCADMFGETAKWEVAYVCECCSGGGIVDKIEYNDLCHNQIAKITTLKCPECHGDKMIWSAK